ncbi:DNA polymerase ligase N-terminal domain-containing protein [Anaerohalosphaeraceae bacterium U12dextr]
MMAGPDNPYVIQQHTTPDGCHWDLMLQRGDCLWTWRMPVSPEQILSTACVQMERIADHPLRFLSYEGPVQNHTGQVTIADRGVFRWLSDQPEALSTCFHGTILHGVFTLTRQSGSRWMLVRQNPI